MLGQRGVRPAPLSGIPDVEGVPPRRVDRGELDALLNSELDGYRVIAVGPAGDCAGAYGSCTEPIVSPAELVAAVEHASARVGDPVALLVLDAGRISQDGRRPPLEDLRSRVDGRFPLWVVDGPADWT